MQNAIVPDLILDADCETAIAQVTFRLGCDGLQVVRSFDLSSACAPFTHDICPHTGQAPCDCRLAVLFVYGRERLPVSLVAHQCGGQTEFCLMAAEWPPFKVDLSNSADLERDVRRALTSLAHRSN